MINRSLAKTLFFLLSGILFSLLPVNTVYAAHSKYHYPHFYLGGIIAYGETTWPELETWSGASADESFLVNQSAPKSAVDFGSTWGGFLGYQFDTAFAVEVIYMRYPNSRITFIDDLTYYAPVAEFVTHTQVYSLVGKFLYPLANARINAFLDAGVAFTNRSDVLEKVTRVAPTFGLGFMCNVSRRVITELGFEYYVGYGRSELRPVNNYIPFLFSVYFRLGYRLF